MEFRYHNYTSDVSWYYVAPGFQWKSGPGHSWLVLDSRRLAQMKRNHPELVQENTCSGFASNYEEDCEFALVVLAFWQLLTPEFNLQNAINTVSYWYPVSFNEWIVKCLQTGEIAGILKALPEDFHLSQHNAEEPSTFKEWVEVIKEYYL